MLQTRADEPAANDDAHSLRAIGLLIGALIAVRLCCAAALPLAFDEAYYWLWSQHLAGGYYDHPPMVALVIRLGTALAGDTEFGVRLVAVLLAVPASWAVWRAADLLFADRLLAARAALYFNLTLMVAGGMLVATPDAPLLAACALLMWALAKLAASGRGVWWLAVGAAAGFGLLAKYSMLFLGIGIVLWLLLAPSGRRHLRTPWPYLGGLLALAIFMPVIVWNAEHGWVSLLKQFGRTAVEGFSPRYLGEHLAVQFGLATPPIFILGVLGLWAFARGTGASRDARILLGALVWPLSLYFLWHSLHGRVEGNWTAPLFPAFAICAAAAAAKRGGWGGAFTERLAALSRRSAVPVGLALTAMLYAQAVFAVLPLGSSDPTARQLGAGWRELGAQIDAQRLRAGAGVVMTDSYATAAWLAFYLPSRPPVVQRNERARWSNMPEPDAALFKGPVLYVCAGTCDNLDAAQERFAQADEVADLARTRRGVEIESYRVFRFAGARGDPLDHSSPPELR